MRKLLFLCFSVACLSFDTKPGSIEALMKANMAKINDAYYCAKYETSNEEWKEYCKATSEKNALPDSNVWLFNATYNKPLVENYYRHPAFNKYPVVGVSYTQVQDFLKWKTDNMNKILEKAGIEQKVEFRLPTQEEWEELAKAQKKSSFKTRLRALRSPEKEEYNFKTIFQDKFSDYNLTAPVDAFAPNTFGIHNMHGNVAEMIDKQGIAKGGSWNHTEIQSSINQNMEYSSATSWLGFRYVMVVKGKGGK